MNYGIIDTATNRLVSFTNFLVDYPGCHCIELEYDFSLLGKKLEGNQWISSNEPYVSEHAKFMEAVLPRTTKTAEEWLADQGYSPTRLVTLLDFENKLAQAGTQSAKLTAARSWVDGILESFIQDPIPKNNWAPAPHTFEETVQEAAERIAILPQLALTSEALTGEPVINAGGIARIQRVTAMPENPDPDTLYIVIP